MASEPAGEQKWPVEWRQAIARMIDQFDPAHHHSMGQAMDILDELHELGALRPPAGVDGTVIAEIAERHAMVISFLSIGDNNQLADLWTQIHKDVGTLLRILHSHHTAVTAAGVDTVGHTDVTVGELAQLLSKINGISWKSNGSGYRNHHRKQAQSIIDQFNVTRKK